MRPARRPGMRRRDSLVCADITTITCLDYITACPRVPVHRVCYHGTMLDWIGSLRLRERSSMRVVLALSRSTRAAGWVMSGASGLLAYATWAVSIWLVAMAGVGVLTGALLATLQRRLVFDRAGGVLEVEQGVFGVIQRTIIPLFHLRAVVIVARAPGGLLGALAPSARYLAYLDRRVGDAIYLDESGRCADLLPMAEAIAEVAELRLEYDATSQASGGA